MLMILLGAGELREPLNSSETRYKTTEQGRNDATQVRRQDPSRLIWRSRQWSS